MRATTIVCAAWVQRFNRLHAVVVDGHAEYRVDCALLNNSLVGTVECVRTVYGLVGTVGPIEQAGVKGECEWVGDLVRG